MAEENYSASQEATEMTGTINVAEIVEVAEKTEIVDETETEEVIAEAEEMKPTERQNEEINEIIESDVVEGIVDEMLENAYQVSFAVDQHVNVTIYKTQDTSEKGIVTDVAYARNSESGEIDCSGDGQVNFRITVDAGFALLPLEITEGSDNYKNLKEIEITSDGGVYRMTKVKGNVCVCVTTTEIEDSSNKLGELEELVQLVPKYIDSYYTAESAGYVNEILAYINDNDLTILSNAEIEVLCDNLEKGISNLKFKTAEVPQIYISTSTGKGNELQKVDGYLASSLYVVDTDGTVLSGDGEIKVRGNTTAYAPKKAFNMKFSSKQNVLGMGAAKKWCLMANCYDTTLMRNYIATSIAHEMGLEYTSEQRYVEVWVDGTFKGCYLLMEAVQEGKTRVNINLDKGEFLIQLERDREEEGVTYVTNKDGLRFELCDPEVPTDEQLTNVQNVIDNVTAAIASGNYSNVEEIIDVESFAKFYLLNEYMKNVDFNFSSVYFYYKSGKLYAGPVWDFDMSTGNIYKEGEAKWDSLIAYRGNWYRWLLQYSEFQQLVKEDYLMYYDYLTNVYAEGGFIDQTVATYGEVFQRNFGEAGWDVSKQYNRYMRQPYETYEENVEYLRSWLKQHNDYLYGYIVDYVPNVIIDSVEAGDNHIEITWRTEPDVDYYRVSRKTEDGSWEYVSGRITGNTFSDYSADAQTVYYYKVVSVKNGQKCLEAYPGISASLEEKVVVDMNVISQPSNVEVEKSGDTARFEIEVSGEGVAYMWYAKTPGSDRFVKTGVSTPYYDRKIYTKNDGIEVYCEVSDVYGHKTTSDIVSAIIKPKFAIVNQPCDVFVGRTGVGTPMTFTVEATGTDLTYSWYYKKQGESSFHKAGVYADTYVKSAKASVDGMEVYCVVTNSDGEKLISNVATAYISSIEVIEQSEDAVVKAGNVVSFSVVAQASSYENGSLTYSQDNIASYSWYVMVPIENGGDGIFHKAGVYGNVYSKTAWNKNNGMQVYCLITDIYGNKVESNIMSLFVE